MPTIELSQRGSAKRDPFQIKFSPKRLSEFTDWIVNEIRQGISARSKLMNNGGLIDAWQDAYEQAERARSGPWPGAADLSSWILCEKVDAMKSRLLQTVFGVDPICMVEGWGETSDRAAKVEAFHQWQATNERLRTWLGKGIHRSLIEGNGILECSERAVMRRSVSEMRLLAQLDPSGAMMLDEKSMPMPAVGPDGKMLTWNGEDVPNLSAKVAELAYVSKGPQYRIVSCKDFLMLPAHAQEMSEVFLFAKRFYRRMPELQERAKSGWYDTDAVASLGNAGEREQRREDTRQGISIAPEMDQTAEKELWECQLLYDVEGDGIEQWVLATVSERHGVTLRVQEDDLNQTRFINLCPYPRENSIWGYSFVGNKLWTLSEEHAAMRNMIADRSAMVTSAPIKKSSTSKWNPDEQPWGPRSVITVQSMNEIEPVQVPDVPNSAVMLKRDAEQASERVSGLNDLSTVGASTPEGSANPTATQVATQGRASFVRVDDPLHHIQESIADLYTLRNRIWKKTLETTPDGLEADATALIGLITRGITMPQDGPFKFTAADLEGNWSFVPRGSTETADIARKRSSLNEFVGAVLPRLMQMFPMMGQQLMMNPKVGQVIFTDMMRAYGLSNLMPYLMGSPTAQPMNPIAQMMPQVMAALGGQAGGNVVPFAPPGSPQLPAPQQQMVG
jgi:hypothetical protein